MGLVVAGDGPQRRELQQLADSLGLSNVDFVGQGGPAERDSLIAKSRFTVLPSHAYETLGKTILESYAEGRAVVASDLGSRRELVREGETGLLYRSGDVKPTPSFFITIKCLSCDRQGGAVLKQTTFAHAKYNSGHRRCGVHRFQLHPAANAG